MQRINMAVAGLGVALALTSGCVVGPHGRVWLAVPPPPVFATPPPPVVFAPPPVVVAPIPLSLRQKAERGDPLAQFTLGSVYANGRGVPRDYRVAVHWYYLSAQQEYAPAQNRLGMCFYHGWGTQQNYASAVAWYRKAARQGDAPAQDNLGICYYTGRGVPQNFREAAKWYRLAAAQGNQAAAIHLRQVEGLIGGTAVAVSQPGPGGPATQTTPAASPPPPAPAEPAEAASGTPMTVDEIKELSSAGVKSDALIEQIKSTNSKFTAQDIASAQQANLDATVIACMKENQR